MNSSTRAFKTIILVNSKNTKITVNAQIADDPLSHMRGLMFRSVLAKDEGMLFAFPNEAYRSFWMMFTKIALDAIFFDKDGQVVEIIQMQPCNKLIGCPTYNSKTKSKYVLEVNFGFASKNFISPQKSKLLLE
ncbi:DUF192 domain-containing protein [Candidatus Micrarchaeota archaeon]|nr:DUF192 domain-containing protein [Candidatus Micrarchaeota archaeon]